MFRPKGAFLSAAIAVIVVVASAVTAWALDSGPKPSIKAELSPSPLRTGDTPSLTLKLGENTVRAKIVWLVDGKEVEEAYYEGYGPAIELDRRLKAEETVEARITPESAWEQKGDVKVLKATVRNSQPILKLTRQEIKDGRYEAEVSATDPEGEEVTLTLTKAPGGMTIDDTGLIQWDLGRDTAGSFNVEVEGKDASNGKSILRYSFSIRR
jgi:hypothetical protein